MIETFYLMIGLSVVYVAYLLLLQEGAKHLCCGAEQCLLLLPLIFMTGKEIPVFLKELHTLHLVRSINTIE